MDEDTDLIHLSECSEKSRLFFQNVVSFLNTYFWIYNGHMTRVLSTPGSLLYKFPTDWQTPLLELSYQDLNQVPFGLVKNEWPPSLKEFLQTALNLGRPRFLPFQHRDLCGIPNAANNPVGIQLPRSLLRGITPKKLEEVEGMARLISSVCSQNSCYSVLDIGAGMGYLDQVLHYRYGLSILGVDAAYSHGAQTRINKVSDVCSKNISFLPFTLHPTEESILELRQILARAPMPTPCSCQNPDFPCPNSHSKTGEKKRRWVVVALHSCGDLVNSILRLYLMCPEITCLICLGCCYHKMSPGSFPLSKQLKTCLQLNPKSSSSSGPLGVYGLRLASQETRARWETTSEQQHITKSKHTLYRAVLEYALSQETLEWKRPQRRLPKSCFSSFQEYCDLALAEYDHSIKEKAVDTYLKFQDSLPLLQRLALLQVLLQPILEGLILLDRVSFLREGYNTKEHHVMLEAIAPEILTPRNVAIIAIKPFKTVL